jgi:phosphoenolpyruvate-protein phosphotransferase
MAEGPVVCYQEEQLHIPRYAIKDPETEYTRLMKDVNKAIEEIAIIKEGLEREGAVSEAAVFDAHKMFLEDPSLLEMAKDAIQRGLNAESAWMDAVEFFAKAISAVPDETLSARSADVRDVGRRVLRILCGIKEEPPLVLREPSIILALDLAPSQTATLEKAMISGLCTAAGGPTSHTAILAKALGIPALVGLGEEVLHIESGAYAILDANAGVLVAKPDYSMLEDFRQRWNQAKEVNQEEQKLASLPAMTKDGYQVEVVANVGSLNDTISAIQHGAEGIGLLRTEFLYLGRKEAPEENEQVDIYKPILDLMAQRPVVVRTLDIGGDKEIPYLKMAHEENPFLGWRAIRICLDQPDLFKTQLRALLRASSGHDVRIMFPMVATLGEVRAAKQAFYEAKREIESDGHPFSQKIQLGIMVEVPSVVVMADRFAREVDFFSIGTNDLTQYTFAADRGNERVVYLSDPCHPAVLRQIKRVIEVGHQSGIWVGLCGEMAGDPDGVPILLGLGLDEFSISSAGIPHAKAIIRGWTMAAAERLADDVLELESAEEVRELVRKSSPEI